MKQKITESNAVVPPEDQKDESNQYVREIIFFRDIKVELNDWF